MKQFNKLILSVALVLAMVMGIGGQALASGSASSSGSISEREAALERAINQYFQERKTLLATGETGGFSAVAEKGVVSDELNHRKLANACYSDTIVITNRSASDESAFADVLKITEQGKIAHELMICKNSSLNWVVVSDGYKNEFDGFTSSYYISPEEKAELLAKAEEVLAGDMLTAAAVNGSTRKSSFLNIANAQVGYLEKASDYNLNSLTANPGTANWTKYGKWGWGGAMEWCAALVSWCGNQAGLSTAIIPKTTYGSVAEMRSAFTGLGRYHLAASYTPVPGDIFIIKNDTTSHVGIVVSVTSSAIAIIDGNVNIPNTSYDGVRSRTIGRSLVTGYGNPNWCYGNAHAGSGTYNYVSSNIFNHWEKCACCGEWVEEEHSWIDYSGYYKCSECGMISTTISTAIGDSEY